MERLQMIIFNIWYVYFFMILNLHLSVDINRHDIFPTLIIEEQFHLSYMTLL